MIGLIFDCDGTLIDSEESHFLSWQKTFAKRGYDLQRMDYHDFAGCPGVLFTHKISERLKIPVTEVFLQEKLKTYSELQKKGLPPIQPMVGFVKYLLENKKKLGIKIAVASGADREELLNNLEHLGLKDGLDAVVSGSDDLKEFRDPEGVNKPKPYIYQHTAKILEIKPSKCAAFEDSHTGLQAAVNAGLITFACPNSFISHHDFSKAMHVLENECEIIPEKIISRIHAAIHYLEKSVIL